MTVMNAVRSPVSQSVAGIGSGGSLPTSSFALLETGDKILLESGDSLVLE